MRSTFRRLVTCVLLLCFFVFAVAAFAALPDEPKPGSTTAQKPKPGDKSKSNKDKLSDERLSTRDLDSPGEDAKPEKPAKKDSKPPAKPAPKPDAKDPK